MTHGKANKGCVLSREGGKTIIHFPKEKVEFSFSVVEQTLLLGIKNGKSKKKTIQMNNKAALTFIGTFVDSFAELHYAMDGCQKQQKPTVGGGSKE